MPNLTFRERFKLAGLLARGALQRQPGFDDMTPGSVGYELLSRIYPGTVGDPPKRGTQAFLEAYSTSPWLRAVAARVSNAVAMVEWRLYATKRQGATKAHRDFRLQRADATTRKSLLAEREAAGELQQIQEHPLLSALDKGNAYQTGHAVRKVTMISVDTIGEAFWLKERNGLGAPIAFWPIPATWVLNPPTVRNPFYRVSFRGWNTMVPASEILWFIDPDPANPYGRGSGQGQALADELDTDEYAAKHTRQFFANRARPDIIVSPKNDDTLKPSEVARLEQQWVNQHQGFWRAFKPFFASRAIDVKELDQDFRSLQLVQLRQHERDTILQVYGGIPPEMLGIVENSNRATIDAADYLFARWTQVPRLEFLRTFFQARLVQEYDERLIIDYVSPVATDKTAELEAMKAAPWAATVDEWRQRQGLSGLENGAGDVHMVPSLLTPMKTLDEPEPVDPVVPMPVPPALLPPVAGATSTSTST